MNHTAVIRVLVPGPLRRDCDGAAELPLSASDVAMALAELERLHPVLHRSVCHENGAVRRHVNLFVNHHHIRDCQGLATPLVAGDALIILPAVSGG